MSLTLVGTAHAAGPDGPDALGVPLEPATIYGGTDVAACGWPSTVDLEGSCTGTLVHPQVVIYAAHCGTGYNQIWFGENIDQPTRQVPTEFCRAYPGQESGTDFAFCKLQQPQMDVPIVPILMGCEVDKYLVPGQQVTVVGFGDANTGPYGIKREVTTTINNIQNNEAFIGGNGKDSCQGDSGGPVFLQVEDGTWRVFGITSYGGACGTGGYYSMMHMGIQWFEQESGIDLTPCFDAAGNWTPGGGCLGFPTSPGTGGGSWANGCGGGPVGGASTTCGGGLMPDVTPPTVTIVTPPDLAMFQTVDTIEQEILVDAVDEPGGWGVKEVQLLIEEMPVGAPLTFAPYTQKANFPSGVWCIGATATDLAGNVGVAVPHCIGVNEDPNPPPPITTDDPESTDGSGTGGDTDTGVDTDTEGSPTTGADPTNASSDPTNASGNPTLTAGLTDPGGDDSDEGCACDATDRDPKASLLLVLGLALLGRRKRR